MNIIDDIELETQKQNKAAAVAAKKSKIKKISDYDVFIKKLHSLYQRLLPLNLGTATVVTQGWADCEGTKCTLHVVLKEKRDGFFSCNDGVGIEYRSKWNLFGPIKKIGVYQSVFERNKLDCYGLIYKPEKQYAFEPEEIYQLIIKELIQDKFEVAKG
jgi:hypothetical protein